MPTFFLADQILQHGSTLLNPNPSFVFLLGVHSLFRWIIILTGGAALLRMWSGVLSGSEWTKADRLSGLVFTTFLNLQFILGLVLCSMSPLVQTALKNFHASMHDDTSRFFTVEHPFGMILAVISAQVGFSISKRAPTDRAKFLRAAVAYTIAGILILISIPWPFLPYGRPLLPVFTH